MATITLYGLHLKSLDLIVFVCRWVTPVAMTLYLLCANILIINLLIAVFNNIYQQVNIVVYKTLRGS